MCSLRRRVVETASHFQRSYRGAVDVFDNRPSPPDSVSMTYIRPSEMATYVPEASDYDNAHS
jgi:hypothetical protein